jgi:cyanophycinase
MHAFLIGGGREPEGVRAAHVPFTAAAGGLPILVYALDEGDGIDAGRWEGQLEAAGAPGARVVAISPRRSPVPCDLDGAGGVYIAGGLTPGYHAVLVAGGTGWLERARELGVPYAGYSAGAAIAAEAAILGGWQAGEPGREVPVCHQDAGEDLDLVAAVAGLGLAGGCVDVHAAQWGTLARALAVVRAGAGHGVAIDEHTTLELDARRARVHGSGAVHRLEALGDGRVAVTALLAGDGFDIRTG